MAAENKYDAFLSYNNQDNATVELFARQLKEKGLNVFLDRWYLIPGSPWTIHLEQILAQCNSVVVFLGNAGLGSWQQREQNLALDRQAHDGSFNVIPVLLPGSDPPLGFLSLNTWIDFRGGTNNNQLLEWLVSAIQGKALGPYPAHQTADTLESFCPYRGLQYFREEDAPFFFGRNDFVGKLEKVVQNKSLVAVVGPSGSGKSSVVRAGLVPVLRKNANGLVWDIGTIIPGNQPLQSLAALLISLLELDMTETDRLIEIAKLAASLKAGQIKLKDVIARCLAKQTGTNKLMLIVDQWEELYTLATDAPTVATFIDELMDAANTDFFCRGIYR